MTHPLPTKDPISGQPLTVTELTCESSGVILRGRFEIPRLARLDPDHASFLETFLRCRGVITSVEKELGISYPTVRAKLDTVLEALGLAPVRETAPKRTSRSPEERREILEQLEKGEITPDEAKQKLRAGEEQ